MANPVKEFKAPSHLSQESIKIIAESVGVSNISDEAAKILADDISYRLKVMVQVRMLHYLKPHFV